MPKMFAVALAYVFPEGTQIKHTVTCSVISAENDCEALGKVLHTAYIGTRQLTAWDVIEITQNGGV